MDKERRTAGKTLRRDFRFVAIVVCPACGQQVEVLATEDRVKGYCAVAKQYVSFQIEAQRIPISKNRDSRGLFIKGNVPWNKRGELISSKKGG